MTPQNLIDWKVDVIQAKASANAQAACVDLPQPTRAQAPAPPPQQRKARMTVQEEQIADVAVIHRALMDNWIDSVPEHAAALLAIARKVEASIPASAVADLVHQLAMKYVNKARGKGGSQVKITWSVGWFQNDIDGAVHLWKHNRDAAQRATGTGQ